MKVIAGCVIRKDNKILMVKEASKRFYGQWSYPAGKVEELRGYDVNIKAIYTLENNNIYPLEIFETNNYNT